MIFYDALQSLKNDFSRTFFYFLTFFITTMFMFLFFNMAISEMAVNEDIIFVGMATASEYLRNGDIANIMMAFVVVISCVDIIFANQFFIRNKAEELAVRLVCGATFTQLTGYLLTQTFLILLISIPLGIICGLALIPVLNSILQTYLSSPFVITLSSEAIAQFVVITFGIVLWTTMLNISYIYQNEAAKILNGQGSDTDKQGSVIGQVLTHIPPFLRAVIGLCAFLYPLYAFYTATEGMATYSIIGLIGMDLMITYLIIPFITNRIKVYSLKNPIRSAYLGFFRSNLTDMKVTIYLFITCNVLMISTFITRMENEVAYLMIIVTFVFLNILQAMTIMFRYQTIQSTRDNELSVLSQLGFERIHLIKIIRKETILFFSFILFITLLYLVNIFNALILQNIVTINFSIFSISVMTTCLIVAGIISYFYYRAVLKNCIK